MADISILTVALSAGVSVFTGYVGTLMNYRRQRKRHRRTYGLSLLAEIKAIDALARQYYGTFGRAKVNFETYRLPKLRFSNADMSVFNNVSGNVGLFSTRAAVEIINYYSMVRNLVAQAQALIELQEADDKVDLRQQLADHLRLLRSAQRQTAQVVRTLRRETPIDLDERLYVFWRRGRLRLRRSRRRLRSFRVFRPFGC